MLKETKLDVIAEYDIVADQFKLLCDKNRLMMMALLKEEELCVCHMVDILQMSQPSVSQHVRKLKAAAFVLERRQGQWIYYSINPNVSEYIKQVLEGLPSMKEIIRKYKTSCC